jgi:hypothetical protein
LVAPAGDFFLTKAQEAAVGAMAAGAITALVIEVMALPYTLIPLALRGLGILGLAQFGVTAALASGVRARWHGRRALPFAAISAEIFAAPSPNQSYKWSLIDSQLQALKSEDAAVVENRVARAQPLSAELPALRHSSLLVARHHAYPGLADEVERVLGPNPADRDPGDPHS